MGHSVTRRQLRARQKGGDGVGKTKRGKGTKVMLVADGNGLPIGFCLASASCHEVKLAVPALQTVRVARLTRGRPRQRPDELVADKAYDSKRFRRWLCSKRIKPTIPSYERRARKQPKPGEPVQAMRSVGRSRGPSPGWATSGSSWYVTNAICRPSGPSFCSRSYSSSR